MKCENCSSSENSCHSSSNHSNSRKNSIGTGTSKGNKSNNRTSSIIIVIAVNPHNAGPAGIPFPFAIYL